MNRGKHAGGFAALEDYDGYEFVFENGYCARFEFKRDETRRGAHSYKILLEDFFREVERVLRELSVNATPVNLRKRR